MLELVSIIGIRSTEPGRFEEADLLFHTVLEDGEVLSGQSVTNLRPGPSSTLTFSATRLAPLRKTASLFCSAA